MHAIDQVIIAIGRRGKWARANCNPNVEMRNDPGIKQEAYWFFCYVGKAGRIEANRQGSS